MNADRNPSPVLGVIGHTRPNFAWLIMLKKACVIDHIYSNILHNQSFPKVLYFFKSYAKPTYRVVWECCACWL